jgi:hypothetical protein
MKDEFHYINDKELVGDIPINEIIEKMKINFFKLENYTSEESIPAKMLAYNK